MQAYQPTKSSGAKMDPSTKNARVENEYFARARNKNSSLKVCN